MKEIIYKPSEEEKPKKYSSERCLCGGTLYHSQVPCPDGMPGCLVIHYGYRCEKCGRIYQ